MANLGVFFLELFKQIMTKVEWKNSAFFLGAATAGILIKAVGEKPTRPYLVKLKRDNLKM